MPVERRSMPVGDWPAIDRRLWTDGIQPVSLFSEAGAGASWAPSSRAKVELGYGSWLVWLRATGQLDHANPGDRVTPERVAAYILELGSTRSSYTRVNRMRELYDAMRVLAPGGDWGWLAQLVATLRARAEPVRNKRLRLRPVGDLVDLGHRLMHHAETARRWSPPSRAAGLMIALLAYRPIRVKNYAAIRLGQHLVQESGRYWLLFRADETKTHQPYEVAFPEALVPALDRYLDRHRPVLLRRGQGQVPIDPNALWISEAATPLTQRAISQKIRNHTRRAFGRSLPPHWFRDSAATSIAIENPKHVRDARLVLGHASLATTEQHYNQAKSLAASRRHHTVLANLRTSLAPA